MDVDASASTRSSHIGGGWVGLLGTVLIGLFLRWYLAGVGLSLPTGTTVAHLRHAHSHLGYYAVLVPLVWLAWESGSGRRVLRRWERWLYGTATIVATIGFVRAGYGVLGIAGSTIVGTVWMVAGWRIARHTREADHPLVVVFPGTLLALACIPLIAGSLRTDPAFAAAAVQSFLTLMLFLVVAPGGLAALGVRQRWTWGSLVTGALAALALGLWSSTASRIGLALHAIFWLDAARRMAAPVFALPWWAAGLGLLAVAAGAIPLTHDVAIGALHFLILGPLLSALARDRFTPALAPNTWWWHHAAVLLLCAPLLLRGITATGRSAGIASAIGGTAVVAWWLAVLARRRAVPPAPNSA